MKFNQIKINYKNIKNNKYVKNTYENIKNNIACLVIDASLMHYQSKVMTMNDGYSPVIPGLISLGITGLVAFDIGSRVLTGKGTDDHIREFYKKNR